MTHESLLRLGAFLAALGFLSIWEAQAPRLRRKIPKWRRWFINFTLGFLALALVQVTVGALAFGSAVWAQRHGWGLFHLLAIPSALGIPLAFLLLDLGIYAQHVATHFYAPLWRLHQIHHADLEMDTSTALRFHPLEILLSMAYKALLVVLFGAAPVAVAAFELSLSLGSLFTHANGRMPGGFDRILRWVVVTPAMHTVHHSNRPREANSNFGFSLSLWDRLFGTYLESGKPGLELGLAGVPENGIGGLLLWPFREHPFPASVPVSLNFGGAHGIRNPARPR